MRHTTIPVALAIILSAAVASAQGNYGGMGPIPVTWTNPVVVVDDSALSVGDDGDFSCVHDGTDTICTSSTGDFVIDNVDVNDPTVLRLGTDTSATSLIVENNSGEDLLTVNGAGTITVGPDALPLTLVDCAGTAGAESGDNIPVVIVCTDQMGDAVAVPIAIRARAVLSNATGLVDAANYTITEDGAGSLVTSHVTSTYIEVLTDATGHATIDAADVNGASSGTIILDLSDAGNPSGIHVVGSRITITFDGA